jgi:ABC-type lipoprotein release transport system permease subunit
MMDGWDKQAQKDTIAWEIGQGQIWEKDYDPYDPFTLIDAHAPMPTEMKNQVVKGDLVPILVIQGSIYPQGRMQNIILKGIPADQKILELPTGTFVSEGGSTSAIIGKRMADATKLKKGDHVLLRWRDKNGMFDAKEITIAHVFDTNVPAIDNGQVWIPLADLQEMTGMQEEATLLVTGKNYESVKDDNWIFKSKTILMADLEAIIQSKKGSAGILYVMLLGIALLAIFDTQVLSIFRRQKEIGTYIALGMTRGDVVKLFTIEGGAHSLLAAGVGAIYGLPLLLYLNKTGIPMPAGSDGAGVAISSEIFPVYGLSLVLGTILLVVISATIVSYMPARKIARMNPTEALKGKIL